MGALYGIAVKIRKSRPSVCGDTSIFFHRKGLYSIPVQAIFDLAIRFLFFSAKYAGPTHESVVFSVSSLVDRLHAKDLPRGFCIAADEAYVWDEQVVNLIDEGNAKPDSYENEFNFFQSSVRMHIK